MTRKRKQDKEDYEKENGSKDDEGDVGPLHHESFESID
jgi:hypothetical protein